MLDRSSFLFAVLCVDKRYGERRRVQSVALCSAIDDNIQDEFDDAFGRLRTVVMAVVRMAMFVVGTKEMFVTV